MRLRFVSIATALLAGLASHAQQLTVPPMGWNSWDAYGLTITEPQFRSNVEVLNGKLKPFGYNYAVIDEGWFFFNPDARPTPDTLQYAVDANGRYVPVPARFPSAGQASDQQPTTESQTGPSYKLAAAIETTSFKPLADWVHAQGLKFGIHIVRGIPRASVERNLPIADSSFHAQDAADTTDPCGWDPTNWGLKDNAAGQAWYDSLLAQYASWGVDLLKVDCISDHPYKVDEIRMIRRAIDKAGRPMVLSLSPGPTNPSHAAEVDQLATMWRISNDVWDVWQGGGGKDTDGFPQAIKGQFDRAAQWAPLDVKHFPDLDMLPFGELKPSPGWGKPRTTRLTLDEQRTLFALWAINRSPLILGANLTELDAPTLALITNKDVLAIDQNGSAPREVARPGDLRIWRVTMPGNRFAVGLFNLGDQPLGAHDALAAFHAAEPKAGKLKRKDLWTGHKVGKKDQIPPHGVLLFQGR